jgi:hypothetical protein
MAVFAGAAGNQTLPISGDYGAAAQMIDMSCGPSFVDAGVKSSGTGLDVGRPDGLVGLLGLVMLLMSVLG